MKCKPRFLQPPNISLAPSNPFFRILAAAEHCGKKQNQKSFHWPAWSPAKLSPHANLKTIPLCGTTIFLNLYFPH